MDMLSESGGPLGVYRLRVMHPATAHPTLLHKADSIVAICLHKLLRLYTPNIILMDLVIFLSYLIRLTYDSHAASMLLFSFHIMPHAHLTSFISVQCMAMLFFSSILPLPSGCLMSTFSSIPWLCLMHATNACCHIPSLCWDSSVDPIQISTYTCSSI